MNHSDPMGEHDPKKEREDSAGELPEESREELDEEGEAAGTGKARKAIKIGLLVFLILLVLLLAATGAILLPLLQSYQNSHVNASIVTREEEYSRPPLPSDVVIVTGEPGESDDFFAEDPDETEEPLETDDAGGEVTKDVIGNGIYYVKQKNPDVENILLLGSDSRSVNSVTGRTDSMIVVSYNKKTGEVKMVSLLRDLLVPIEGHDWNRLNTAFAFGGISLCINTINDLFGLDIQEFVIINFGGTEKLVDKCGGVNIKLSSSELEYLKSQGGSAKKNSDGTYHLNGASALIHMRNRKVGSDFSRTDRQRTVIEALYRQVMAKKNPTEIYSMIREGFKLVSTNIELSHLLELAQSVVSVGGNLKITSDRIPQDGTWQNAAYKKKSVLTFDIEKNAEYLQGLLYGN